MLLCLQMLPVKLQTLDSRQCCNLRDDVAARVKALCAYDLDLDPDKCVVTNGETFITGKMAAAFKHQFLRS